MPPDYRHEWIWSCSSSDKDRKFYIESLEKGVNILNFDTQEVSYIETGFIFNACLSSDGQHLVTAASDNTNIFSTKNGNLIESIPTGPNEQYLIKMSETGDLFARVSFDENIEIYNVKTSKLVKKLEISGERVFDVGFVSSDKFIYTTNIDGRVTLRRLGTPELLPESELQNYLGYPRFESIISNHPERIKIIHDASFSQLLDPELKDKKGISIPKHLRELVLSLIHI